MGLRNIMSTVILNFDYESISNDDSKISLAYQSTGWMVYEGKNTVRAYFTYEYLHQDGFMRDALVDISWFPNGVHTVNCRPVASEMGKRLAELIANKFLTVIRLERMVRYA